MSKHAGFAAVLQARQAAAQAALQVYHAAGLIPVTVTGQQSFPNPAGSGTVTLTYNLFHDVPRIVFSATAGGRIRLDLRLLGPCTVDVQGAQMTRQVIIRAAVSAFPSVTVAPAGVSVGVVAGSISVDSLTLDPLDGSPLPAQFTANLMSPAGRLWLNTQLRQALMAVPTFTPPMAVPFVANLGSGVAVSRSVIRILDGAIAVGVDLSGIGLTGGDVTQIEHLLGATSDLAVNVHPAVVTALSGFARTQAQAQASAQGATVDSLNLAVRDGHLLVTGHATGGGAGGSFELKLAPRVGAPDVYETYDDEYGSQHTALVRRGHDRIWFDVLDVDIDAEVPWWVYLLVAVGSLILLPFAPVIIATVVSIIGSIVANLESNVESGVEGQRLSRQQRLTLPGTSAPLVDFAVSMLRVDLEGFRARTWMRPDWGDATRLTGPTRLDVADLGPVSWSVQPQTALFHPADPLVRVSWQVRRRDTNAVVLSQDRPWADGDAGSCSLDLRDGGLSTASAFSVHCRIYRPVPGAVEELFNQTLELIVADTLDRTRPYVQWAHEVHCEVFETQPDGSRVRTGWHHEDRRSDIHRTAVPGRCRMVTRHTRNTTLQYLDALPFPHADIVANRAQLCDYCFFGGPDKSTPLV